MDRRHNDPQTPHERARLLASDRLDELLDPSDASWLDSHLAGCDECRAIAAAYAEDRALLRAMPVPEPPRDLWARTSVALERERTGRPAPMASARRLRIRWQALAGTVAILLVGVVAGRALLPPTGSGLAVSASATPAGGATADATPLAVSPGDVAWAAPGADGSYTVNLANLDSVCPDNATRPDCDSLDAGAKAIGSLKSRPGQVVLAPEAGQAAVVDASAATTGGSIMVVPMDRPTPAPSSSAGPGVAATPTGKPSATATAGEGPTSAPSSRPPASGSPSPTAGSAAASDPAGSPTASASRSPKPTSSATGSPDASVLPTPTATAAALAIIEDVIVVGGDAAYSADGQWLAFSARPADGSTGPDVFVWRVGDERAEPLTDDHATVFSAWVDDKILASRAAAVSPGSDPSPDPDRRAPISIQLDPTTGKQRGSDLVGLWRPVVDPTGRWVVYWTGTLSLDRETHTLLPADGRLVIDRWDADLGDGPDGTSGSQPLVDVKDADAVHDWEVRWDPTGRFLGLWVADPLTPGLGRLDLLAIDRTTGRVDPDHKPTLRAAPALAGFAIGDGRIAWATPPGQDGDGSRLLVLAWKGPDAGRTRSQPAPEDIVVVR